MDSSHRLTSPCIHFHLSPLNQSDLSSALVSPSTSLLLSGCPSPWILLSQPHGPTLVPKTPRKMPPLLSLPQQIRRREQNRREAYRHIPLPSLLYLIKSFWELRARGLQKMGFLFQNTQDISAGLSLNASPDPSASTHASL